MLEQFVALVSAVRAYTRDLSRDFETRVILDRNAICPFNCQPVQTRDSTTNQRYLTCEVTVIVFGQVRLVTCP